MIFSIPTFRKFEAHVKNILAKEGDAIANQWSIAYEYATSLGILKDVKDRCKRLGFMAQLLRY